MVEQIKSFFVMVLKKQFIKSFFEDTKLIW